MSPQPDARSVPWISIAAVFGCFALFFLIVYLAHLPQHRSPAEVDISQVPPEERWQYSPEGRLNRLNEVRAHEKIELSTYGWIDQKAGVVRLPIERAMELTVRDLQAKK
ncbi:MAG: hypothetical protein KGJ37_07100 [Verrucomicrobiota bacterium]|nr:hypothetical protein [Verrucomicrobiota bacterium]